MTPEDPAAAIPRSGRAARALAPGGPAVVPGPRRAAAGGKTPALAEPPPQPGQVPSSPQQRTAAAGMPSPGGGREDPGTGNRSPSRPARGRPQSPAGAERPSSPVPAGSSPAVTRLAALPPWPAPPAPADVLLQVRLSLPPVPAARPRVSPAEYTRIGGQRVKTRGAHAYNPQDYEDYKRDVGWLFRLARVTRHDSDELGVYGIFHLGLDSGVADGDNLLKAVVDAGNGIGWRDDRQFTEWLARVVRGSGDPHTDLVVYVTGRRDGAA